MTLLHPFVAIIAPFFVIRFYVHSAYDTEIDIMDYIHTGAPLIMQVMDLDPYCHLKRLAQGLDPQNQAELIYHCCHWDFIHWVAEAWYFVSICPSYAKYITYPEEGDSIHPPNDFFTEFSISCHCDQQLEDPNC